MKGFKFKIGAHVADKVTGFEGVIIGRADHISACDTYGVQPPALPEKKNEIPDARWFDEPRLRLVSDDVITIDEREEKTGADSIPQRTR